MVSLLFLLLLAAGCCCCRTVQLSPELVDACDLGGVSISPRFARCTQRYTYTSSEAGCLCACRRCTDPIGSCLCRSASRFTLPISVSILSVLFIMMPHRETPSAPHAVRRIKKGREQSVVNTTTTVLSKSSDSQLV